MKAYICIHDYICKYIYVYIYLHMCVYICVCVCRITVQAFRQLVSAQRLKELETLTLLYNKVQPCVVCFSTHCNTLQHTRCSGSERSRLSLATAQHDATHCNTLQHTQRSGSERSRLSLATAQHGAPYRVAKTHRMP